MKARLIKRFEDAIRSGSHTVDVWGTGRASREFLYIDDAARAIRQYQVQADDVRCREQFVLRYARRANLERIFVAHAVSSALLTGWQT